MITNYHAKYFAHDLTIQKPTDGVEKLSRSLFDACVDLNPHQVDAALFTLRSPLSKGVVLADEVGLGKTTEAGLLLCQFWAERKRALIVVCPAECATPQTRLRFNISQHPVKIALVEQLRGKAGWLTLHLLTIESFQREEYLPFSGIDNTGAPLDQKTCEKLFHCEALADQSAFHLPEENASYLKGYATRHAKAAVSRSLERNNGYFQEERERLERWAEDMILASEKELSDTKAQIQALNRQARLAVNLEEQQGIQKRIAELEKTKRKQRNRIFDIEDEIETKRDQLIRRLEKRISRKSTLTPLFTIQREVI